MACAHQEVPARQGWRWHQPWGRSAAEASWKHQPAPEGGCRLSQLIALGNAVPAIPVWWLTLEGTRSHGLSQLIHFPQLCHHISVLAGLRPLNDYGIIKEQRVN